MPNNAPMMKSHTVMTTTMLAMVKYSDLTKGDFFKRHYRVFKDMSVPADTMSLSHGASLTRSKPNTNIIDLT
jgi:hypothetical protein